MGHLTLLLLFISLIIGTFSAGYSYQLYKTFKQGYLLDLSFYIIFYNIFVLNQLLFDYYIFNIADESQENKIIALSYHKIINFIAYSGMIIYFTRMIRAYLEGKTKSKAFKNFFYGVLGIAMVLFGLNIFLGDIIAEGLISTLSIYEYLFYLYFVVLFAIQFRKFFKNEIKVNQGSALALLYIFSGAYLIFILLYLPFLQKPIIFHIASLFINLLPFVWLRYFYTKNEVLTKLDNTVALKILAEKYSISKREEEVLGHIINGRNNKEIEELLFISVNTVRNHIASIYRKIGVKNRNQLMSVVLNTKK